MPGDNKELKENIRDISKNSIAMELLQEVKAQTKRWMIAFLVVIFLWAGTIGTFVWYLYQYDFSSYDVDSQDGGNANFIGNDGDITNGESKSENAETEER